ncbi:FGGY-family carbohydrate kinase [Hoeflea sp.]|uniref:FGGY-family carbohydrate kinase n=1 Tax=Hoeflea sp. TaxID=1940281 RepID=UPI0019B89CC2|nr:FGGY-family carbohydrate kinase [Hoeflea sp.]MBC7282721.1 carbohydrate kinase [Hoeflea sp.]
MRYLIGIDKGTTMVKSVVFDETGQAVGSADERVAILSPRPGWHEEDPDASWQACCRTIRSAIADAGITGGDVAGVGIAAHMGGAWIVDDQGRPVRNAICWPDERAQSLLTRLEIEGSLEEVFRISGNGLMPGITLMILSWLNANEPEIRKRAAAVLSAKDYLRYRLTGVIATDPSDVSFVPGDIDQRTHSDRLVTLLGAHGWDPMMPDIVPSGAIAGEVTAEAAEETGLAPGTLVITGCGDAVANVVGAGRSRPGEAITVLGTSCLNSLIVDRPGREPEGLGFLFAMPDENYLRILPNTSGTITMDWFLDHFGGIRDAAGKWDFPAMEQRVAATPRGADGVLLLPYVNTAGVLAPFYDPRARGSFFGMSNQTTRDHLMRAVYEALAFATRDCLAAMPGEIDVLTLTGGGARSAFWSQMFADVCKIPIEISTAQQTGATGVALMAGVAAGIWPDLATAQAATLSISARFEPDPLASAQYEDWYDLYRDLRDVYRGFSDRRSRLLEEVRA